MYGSPAVHFDLNGVFYGPKDDYVTNQKMYQPAYEIKVSATAVVTD
jgi:hypothetical protein